MPCQTEPNDVLFFKDLTIFSTASSVSPVHLHVHLPERYQSSPRVQTKPSDGSLGDFIPIQLYLQHPTVKYFSPDLCDSQKWPLEQIQAKTWNITSLQKINMIFQDKTRTFISVLIEVANVCETKAEASARAVQRGTLGDLHRATLDRDVLRRRRYSLKQDSGKDDRVKIPVE